MLPELAQVFIYPWPPMTSHFFGDTTRYSPEMGLGGYRDHSRKLKKPRTWDAGRRGATPRALWTIQRAGCTDSTSLDGDVNYLTSRKPKRMATKKGRPESRPTSSTASYEASYRVL
jgi:hypothetical protein